MKLDFSTLSFGYTIKEGGATPNWATALGQGKGYKINDYDEIEEIIKGMIYCSVPPSTISTKVGKGGKTVKWDESGTPIVLGSVFSNVYVNNELIDNGKFILLITRDTSDSHKGRLRFKYGPSNSYESEGKTYTNEYFFNAVKKQLNMDDKACWYISEMRVINQDTLVFRTIIVDATGSVVYTNLEAQRAAWKILEDNLEINYDEIECEEQKKQFKEWALKRGQIKGIKDATVNGYISSLERMWKSSTIANKKSTPYAYNVLDIKELQTLFCLLTENGDMADSDSKVGFNWYLDFLWDCKKEKDIIYNTSYDANYARNRIIFGAPGTGKSYLLELERKLLLDDLSEDNFERVTFHPDYSYANFVGTYKPVMVTEHSISPIDNDTMYVLSVLTDKSKTAQEKYDELFDKFKDNGLTRLPLLLGIYTNESFKTRKADGTPAANDNDVEKNHGRAIRKYINLIDGNEKPKGISYEYVPGPFMRLYVKALKNAQTDNPKPYLLIIEEINRANVAAVFGDVFQLLDRDDNGVSEYAIQASEDIRKYLAKEMGGEPDDYSKIRIPNNMFIWATMNSADQGVFPMDTAFKRRWDFSYIGIDDNDTDIRDKYVYLAKGKQKVEWNKLRKAINDFLAANKINEDKQLGPYFIGRQIVVPKDGNEIDSEKFIAAFKNKVIMYLFEDAAKQKRPSLFAGCGEKGSRYSDICKEFDEKGINIFADKIVAATGYENIDNPTEDDSTEN